MIRSPKRLLILQVLTLIPLLGFVLVFAKGWFYILALLIAMLLAWTLYRYKQNNISITFSLLTLLIGSFYLYGFYGLGSTQAPQSFHTLKSTQGVTLFEFDEKVKIDKICYFVGIDKNVNFRLEAKTPKGWKDFYRYENSYPYSFSWKCIKKNIQTQSILWRISKNKMMLNEVKFSFENKIIPYKSNKKYLNDETHIAVDTSYYGGMFFDEIYFARTAYEILHDIPVYENTHPYFGKILILSSIKALGMTPFAWRFMSVLFAGLLIFMAYYFALHLFRGHLYGYISAFLMTYSFMHLSQSRIALVDTFGVLFVFISYFYLYRFILSNQLSRLWISGIFFGLAVGIKWSAIFASLGFGVIGLYLIISKHPIQKHFSALKLLSYGFLSYAILAFVVYVLSFWEILAQGGSLKSIYLYNLNAYNYHSTLQATHPYSSPWWSWILDMKPMGYYKTIEDGLVRSINALGNPAIFWLGIVSIFYLIYAIIQKKSLEALFILSAFLGLYLPYIIIGRLMFIYHFYYAVPFLILAIVFMMRDIIEKFRWGFTLTMLYLTCVALLFLAFYPILSAYPIEQSYIQTWLRWFDAWWF